MRDELLARADRIIRESRLIRDQAHQDRVSARIALACVRATLWRARTETEQTVSLCRQTTSHLSLTEE